MRQIFIYIIFATLGMILLACEKDQEVDTFFGEMMEIHHKDMVIWGEIPVLKKQIKQKLEALDTLTSPVDSIQMANLSQTIEELESANDAMNDWMHQFSKPSADTPQEEALSYLSDQKKSMMEMGKEVSDAVISAKELIKTFKTE